MRKMFLIASTCCAVVLVGCPMAWAAFQLIPPATDTDACVYQLSANTAKIVFPGWQTSGTLAMTDYAVIALKHVAAIQSVNSANALVSGFGPTLFSFTYQSTCSSEFGALFGATATAFSSSPSTTVPASTAASLEFVVTLKNGKTITDLVNDLASGNVLAPAPSGPLGGSPVAGSGKSVSGSIAASASVLACLQPGAVIEECDVVQFCGVIPVFSTWGYAAVIVLILGLGAFLLRRRAAPAAQR